MKKLRVALSVILASTSLAFLRLQLSDDLNITIEQAFSKGILLGFFYDTLLICLVYAVAACFKGWAQRVVGISLLIFLFLLSLSNTLYFKMFGGSISIWDIIYHYEDFFIVNQSAPSLMDQKLIFGSVVMIILATLLWAPMRIWESKTRIKRMGLVFAACVVFLLIRNIPASTPMGEWKGNILSDQVAKVWLEQIKKTVVTSHDPVKLSKIKVLRKFVHDDSTIGTGLIQKTFLDENYPLYTERVPDPQHTKELRSMLGLSEDKRPNVIIFFIESWRGFEFLHEELGPELYTNIKALIAKHGILFKQSYSSVNGSASTTRGMFSTQCSLPSNLAGPAVYVARPGLPVNCLGGVLRAEGYNTIWINPYSRYFHNKYYFESLHGMANFYDRTSFETQKLDFPIGNWGADDRDFVRISIELLEKESKEGRPFYATLLNTGTHHPHIYREEAQIADSIKEKYKLNREYESYLSSFKYADRAVGEFFERFFKSSISDNTVVVLLGDHTTGIKPTIEMTPHQGIELFSRVPIAIISKNLTQPTQIEHIVHQIDVAPTVMNILGYKHKSGFMGKDMFLSGSDAMYVFENKVNFRAQNHACYNTTAEGRVRCFELEGKDPLFTKTLKEVNNLGSEYTSFQSILSAVNLLLEKGHVVPEQVQ